MTAVRILIAAAEGRDFIMHADRGDEGAKE
jgi:hypothetical protein